jgi:hypothetical protein
LRISTPAGEFNVFDDRHQDPNRLIVVLVLFGALAFLAITIGLSSEDRPVCSAPADTERSSVARQWNEVLLDAIRRDLPAPTVHSRNLYHASAAMWDAWAAYAPEASGVFVDEHATASNVDQARNEAISYAAFRVLEARYIDSVGASDSIPQFDGLMKSLCYPTDITATVGGSPAAVGNRIAATVLASTLGDGSNEAGGYKDPSYVAVNDPLIVSIPGTVMNDPNRWQPLQIEEMISQNGIAVEDGVQEFIGSHWGFVTSFALPASPLSGVPVDPGPPPYVDGGRTDQEFKDAALEVVRFSSVLDPASAPFIDISPGAVGANPLGTHDDPGHPVNPYTGQPYAPVMVNEGDFGRALAEFWADGPNSETPPGHWNTLSNSVSDLLGPDLRIGGAGDAVPRLEWDVKLYLALNGANHDAAVAAWGAKGFYDYVRPISMIRWMGGLGQSSDPAGVSYDPNGFPLETGLVEVISTESSRAGARHAHLSDHVGEIAILAHAGSVSNPETEVSGVEWIRAVEWVPYQAPTFVTPAFAAYVSGHSTFSRASAEVLTAMTGSEFFPGGLGQWNVDAGSLEFEAGPDEPVLLQWATYQDAADQAGISRLYGGIHVRADDLLGRIMGEAIGKAAWEKALPYFGTGP